MAYLTSCCVHVLNPLFHTVKLSSSKIHVQSGDLKYMEMFEIGNKDIKGIFYASTVKFEQVFAI